MTETPFHSPDWTLAEAPWEPEKNAVWESRFTVCNGYLGVRGFPEEPFDAGPTERGTYLAGVYDCPSGGVPDLVRVADLLAVEILLGGEEFRLADGRVSEYRRALDLHRGLLRRELVYTRSGRSTRLEFERFASMSNHHLLGQTVAVTPLNWRGQVSVRLWTDWRPKGGPEQEPPPGLRLLHVEHMGRDRLLLSVQTPTAHVRIGHACRVDAWVHQAAPPKPAHLREEGRSGFVFDDELEVAQQAVFGRVTATYTSRDHDVVSVERSCLQDLRDVGPSGYGPQRRLHVRNWRRRWERADVTIDGPTDDQQAVRFVIFHLIQACPRPHSSISIAAKGLTGPGYRGHVFWDTEIFMHPFFVCTAPGRARRLLEYRYCNLVGARNKAQAAGYAGAMFPWESADTGEEVCPDTVPDPKTGDPVVVLTARQQQHITADIVYAAWRYWQATEDEVLRERGLLQLAVETARFWASRAEFLPADRQHVIRNVMGPDEYHPGANNNAFTNYLAAWNLRFAADEVDHMNAVHRRSRLLRWLAIRPEEVRRWRAIAEGIRLPRRPDGLWEQQDEFFALDEADPRDLGAAFSQQAEDVRLARLERSQLLKQPDVLMLPAMFPERFSPEETRRNWDYYEPRTTHDSSLSPSIHAIVAADIGLTDRAYEYFRRSTAIDMEDSMDNAAAGLHFAALGGVWQAVVRGFLGLRMDGPAPAATPHLPAAWRRVATQVRHRQRWYAIEATHEEVSITPK